MSEPLKVGDIAVVVSSVIPEKIGMLCTVTALRMRNTTGYGIVLRARVEFPRPVPWPFWNGKPTRCTRAVGWMRAVCLRPIRDQPGEDETLTRVGKPCDTLGRILEFTPKVPVYVEI